MAILQLLTLHRLHKHQQKLYMLGKKKSIKVGVRIWDVGLFRKDVGLFRHGILEPKTEVVVFIRKGILSMTLLHTCKMHKVSCT